MSVDLNIAEFSAQTVVIRAEFNPFCEFLCADTIANTHVFDPPIQRVTSTGLVYSAYHIGRYLGQIETTWYVQQSGFVKIA